MASGMLDGCGKWRDGRVWKVVCWTRVASGVLDGCGGAGTAVNCSN